MPEVKERSKKLVKVLINEGQTVRHEGEVLGSHNGKPKGFHKVYQDDAKEWQALKILTIIPEEEKQELSKDPEPKPEDNEDSDGESDESEDEESETDPVTGRTQEEQDKIDARIAKAKATREANKAKVGGGQ